MNKSLFKYTLGLVVLANIASCKKDNLVVDKEPLRLPEEVKFVSKPAIPAAGGLNYYISETPAPGSPFKIAVGATTVSDVDRKVKITYSSTTAVMGTHFNAPTEVTIPAGKAIDTLTIQGIFAAYPIGRKDVVKVKIVSGDGFIKPAVLQDSFNLTLQRYCDVDFPAFAGDYDETLEYTSTGGISWGPYSTAVSGIVYTPGATNGTAILENLYDYGGEVRATFDWLDKGNFKVTIPEQNTGTFIEDGGVEYALWIRTNSSSVSTFSSCAGTITVFIDAIAKDPVTGVSAGNFSTNYKITMFR